MQELNRIKIVKRILVLLWLIGLSYVFYLQIISGKKYARMAKDLHEQEVELLAERGQIFDRAGRCIAVNRSCFSISILPQYLKNKRAAADILTECGMKDYRSTYRELNQREKFYWYLKQIDYDLGQKLMRKLKNAGLNGAISVVEDKDRFYPFRDVVASVLGFVGSIQPGMKKGWAGIEYQYDSILAGKNGKNILGRDGLGNNYPHPAFPIEPAKPGCNIYLTLDLDIQQIAYEELQACVKKNQANFGSVIVMDTETGEILAMVDYPDFDPNQYQKYDPKKWTSYAVTNEFEPGSSFKLVILATVLTSPNREELLKDYYDVSKGYIIISGKKIKDTHKAKIINFPEIFIHSSNIGVSLLSQKLEALDFYLTARKFGFTILTGVELPGEANGYMDSPRKIRKALRFANNAFGQGLRVNFLQLANAYLAVANDGVLLKPYIIDKIVDPSQQIIYQGEKTAIRQAFDLNTVQVIREILARVVTDGSGIKAKLEGYGVCGKTGTAQKLENGRYSSEKSLMTFVGFFPKEASKYLIAVLVDEPKRTLETRFAGDVTCPLFKNIAKRIVRLKQSELKDVVDILKFPIQNSRIEEKGGMELTKR